MTTTDIRLIIWNLESELNEEWRHAFAGGDMDRVRILDIKLGILRDLDKRIDAARNNED